MKDVAEKDILARIEGIWTDKLYYTLGGQPVTSSAVRLPDHSLL